MTIPKKPIKCGEYLIYAGEPGKLILSKIKGNIGALTDLSASKLDIIKDKITNCDCLCHCDCSGYCDCSPNVCDCNCCNPKEHVELQNIYQQLTKLPNEKIVHGDINKITKIIKNRGPLK
ncbi:hypothetical protein JCM14036_00890 [Desulfotomaculum defluvii]